MASSKLVQGLKHVKPILSTNQHEARRRALNLYKAWYRYLPYMCEQFHVPLDVQKCKVKLREEFNKNRQVTDVRVMDLLIVKGQQDLVEAKNTWKQISHIMAHFKDTVNPKPNDFLSRFYEGHEPVKP